MRVNELSASQTKRKPQARLLNELRSHDGHVICFPDCLDLSELESVFSMAFGHCNKVRVGLEGCDNGGQRLSRSNAFGFFFVG